MDELVSRPSAEELQRELAEVQRTLQDTTFRDHRLSSGKPLQGYDQVLFLSLSDVTYIQVFTCIIEVYRHVQSVFVHVIA